MKSVDSYNPFLRVQSLSWKERHKVKFAPFVIETQLEVP